jgi:outer membrane lipoprotein-sorting protein
MAMRACFVHPAVHDLCHILPGRPKRKLPRRHRGAAAIPAAGTVAQSGENHMSLRVCLLLAGLAGLSATASAITVDELVAKNLEAHGGADKLRAVTSMHEVGKYRLGGGLEAKVESFGVAPDKLRFEFTLQGLTAINAWDGHEGWAVQPFQGRKDPQKTSLDDNKQLIDSADIVGPLVDYKAKGIKVEYLGTEDIDGTDAYKLRATFKNGDSRVIYLDPDQYLEIRIVDHTIIRGQEQVQTTDLGEYQNVDVVYFPFEQGQIHLESAETNKPIDPAMFSFPAAKH